MSRCLECGHTIHTPGNCEFDYSTIAGTVYGRRCECQVEITKIDVVALAKALVEMAPGLFTWPRSGAPYEGTPYKLNALWDAHRFAEAYQRYLTDEA